MKPVAITGLGAVSACGVGADRLWAAARDGVSAVREIDFPRIARQQVKAAARLDAAVHAVLAAQAKPRFQDRTTILALTAAREAVAQAGLGEADFGAGCGVVVGSGFGGAETLERNYVRFVEDPAGRTDVMAIPKIMASSTASWIAMDWKATGPTLCISTACASATQSIGLAADLIRAGVVDRCLAGGAESLLFDAVFSAWESLHVMTTGRCRPFSRDRNGMVLGEGAGVVVLESMEAARARGAEVLAELVGYASTSDAADLLRPDPAGATACMRGAIASSGIEPARIGYCNAHGTGTIANDLTETQALRTVFGAAFDGLLVSSTKPIHGHALGAGGALEFIVTVEALREQIAPPTIDFLGVDPKLDFEPVPNVARPFTADAAMSNSFAFGGINASLVIARSGRG
ncbi:MAG: beta-ketoacyl-[acyl-carrier-protein] synthase family protein [Phyllobacteriaceae bacterium]|nr:beta-ketoacyl-[acyl-carrier-protein] synthase family protein [Phyllobacteriaceae bacterium]